MSAPRVLTLGYGSKAFDFFVDQLKAHGVTHVVDVRSSPASRFNEEFSQSMLKLLLNEAGFKYVYLGDTLGGRPQDDECYEDGHVIYERVASTDPFKKGMFALERAALNPDWKLCIMCAEAKPEHCHRSKLIAPELEARGIEVSHLLHDGRQLSQNEVYDLLTEGQENLFGEVFRSRGKYR